MVNKSLMLGTMALGIIYISSSAYAADVTWCFESGKTACNLITGGNLATGPAGSGKAYTADKGDYTLNAFGVTNNGVPNFKTFTDLYQSAFGLGVNSASSFLGQLTYNQHSIDWNKSGLDEYLILDMGGVTDYNLMTNLSFIFTVNGSPGLSLGPTVHIYGGNSSNIDNAILLGEMTAPAAKFSMDIDSTKFVASSNPLQYLFITITPTDKEAAALKDFGYGLYLDSLIGTLNKDVISSDTGGTDPPCSTCTTSDTTDPVPTPEPSALGLMALGLARLCVIRRKLY